MAESAFQSSKRESRTTAIHQNGLIREIYKENCEFIGKLQKKSFQIFNRMSWEHYREMRSFHF